MSCLAPTFPNENIFGASEKILAQDNLQRPCSPRGKIDRATFQLQSIATGTRRVERHKCLFRKHERLTMLYLVRFGQLKLVDGDLHEQRVVGFHMTGDVLGLEAIATGKHNHCLVALESSEVYEIPFANLAATMSVEPAIQLQVLETMSQALNNEYSRSHSLATMSLDQRFASFLLKLGAKYGNIGYSTNSYQLSMSRAEIAGYLGTTIESVSRLIARFNAKGATLISGRSVKLLNRTYLQTQLCFDPLVINS